MLIEHIDAIARAKQRDVLFLTFTRDGKRDPGKYAQNASRIQRAQLTWTLRGNSGTGNSIRGNNCIRNAATRHTAMFPRASYFKAILLSGSTQHW
jgi:hypothetical protein